MSILIKGMEMPTHCIDCPFMVSRDNDDCILQSAEANENFENWEQMKTGCPLVPIPPHGRLGDLDALMDRIEHDTPLSSTFEKIVRRYIENASTVIPESEEGET